ncbi:TetR/AcrR family transcriptional regulator [Colwelliaceae bacterium BS250]
MNSKREILIDTALSLFYKNGVNSVGINEILKVSGIAKKTLYRHFESKNALVLAALKQRNNTFIEWLECNLCDAKTDTEVVKNLFNALTNWFSNSETELGEFRGCLFINTSAEFSDPSSEISLYCQYHKQQVRELIAENLSNPSDAYLDAICILKEGAITTAYVTNDLSAPQKCIHILEKF